jgi:NAD(P) transhydrogenase subunit alpha
METDGLIDGLARLSAENARLAEYAKALAQQAESLTMNSAVSGHGDFFITGLTVFVLSCFVGYHVVWRVTPALHSPLMAVTNAISSVIIVGALIAAGLKATGLSGIFGLIAVVLASVNISGGFLVTQRMLQMYKKKGK